MAKGREGSEHRRRIERDNLTQANAAKRLDIAQARAPEFIPGKGKLLSLNYLIALLHLKSISLDCLVGLCAKARIPFGVRRAA